MAAASPLQGLPSLGAAHLCDSLLCQSSDDARLRLRLKHHLHAAVSCRRGEAGRSQSCRCAPWVQAKGRRRHDQPRVKQCEQLRTPAMAAGNAHRAPHPRSTQPGKGAERCALLPPHHARPAACGARACRGCAPALYELSVPWPSCPYCGQPADHSLPSHSHMVKSTPQPTLLHLDTRLCGRGVGVGVGLEELAGAGGVAVQGRVS